LQDKLPGGEVSAEPEAEADKMKNDLGAELNKLL